MRPQHTGFYLIAQFQTIHVGHHQITDDNIDFTGLQNFQRFQTIRSSQDYKIISKAVAQKSSISGLSSTINTTSASCSTSVTWSDTACTLSSLSTKTNPASFTNTPSLPILTACCCLTGNLTVNTTPKDRHPLLLCFGMRFHQTLD